MTTRKTLLLSGAIIAGPFLSLALPVSPASADPGPAFRLAQAGEPGGPGERRERERGGPQAPQQHQAPQAQPQPHQPPAAPQQREAPRAAPPQAAPPAPRAEPPRERPQAPPALERREPPPGAERREAPAQRPEPPRERPQAPGPERREPQAPGLERREAPRPEPRGAPQPGERPAPRPESAPAPRPETRPEAAPPRERPAAPAIPPSAAQPRPEAHPESAPGQRPATPAAPSSARPEPRQEGAPGQRPTAPAVPPSATQPRPDLGGATSQPRSGAPGAPPVAGERRPDQAPVPGAPPVPRSTAPNGPAGQQGLAPPSPGLAPPLPRQGENRQGEAAQTRDRGQTGSERGAREEQRDGRTYIREQDNRLIVREGDREIVRHDEVERLRHGARDVDVVQRPNGRREIVIDRPDGDRIITIVDEDGRLLRRERRARDGRTFVLIDNDRDRPRNGFYGPVDLPPLRLDIPRDRYIVEAEDAPYNVIEETLMAPPVERVERPYSLDEIRYNQRLREKVRRVDIDTINFEFGSATVDPDGANRLQTIARAIMDAVRRNPNEVFLIEGHTDAVGSDTDNLALSDRRAESVAAILTERYQVPPENLVTQGYGEQYLKVQTQSPERQNRRVTVRRITPLLQQGQNQAPPR